MSSEIMQSIINRIKLRRSQLALSFVDLGDLTGISKSTLQRYESGGIKNIPLDKLKILATALQTSPEWIMGWEEKPQEEKSNNLFSLQTRKIPLIGTIAAGAPIFAEENFEYFVECGANVDADFCLKVQGDSMINARIFDGDIVFLRRQRDVEDGAIAAVIVDNEATLKRIYKKKNMVILVSENPAYAPMHYSGVELDQIRILGKAVAFQSEIL